MGHEGKFIQGLTHGSGFFTPVVPGDSNPDVWSTIETIPG
jgi:hypothetical protein